MNDVLSSQDKSDLHETMSCIVLLSLKLDRLAAVAISSEHLHLLD